MDDLKILFRIAELIAREQMGDITPEEKKEVEDWLSEDERHNAIYLQLKESEDIFKSLTSLDAVDTNNSFKNTWDKIRQIEHKNRRTFTLPRIIKYAAAVIILVAGSLTIYYTVQSISQRNNHKLSEIKPGTQKAILITADNQQIELGKRGVKQLFRNRKMSIIDTAQTLTYEIVNDIEVVSPEIEYNEVIVPRGGEYTLVLADGSRIKLNADSRLRYPVTFSTDTREVELQGEAFFEVRKSDRKPFLVHTNGMAIQVYGTAFNVSSYNNDNITQTTLVSGSVGIQLTSDQSASEIKLKPGEQANFNKLTHKIEKHEVDIELYTAWVDGIFMFENEPIENILKKLSRWYDFEVRFENEDLKKRSFTGDLRRYDNISTILEMISIASDLEFKIEGKTVIISKSK